jgi:membrane protein implicated in regulation of membrane protease activity
MASGSNGRVLARYALFQIPDLILLGLGLAAAVRWWELPLAAAYALFGLWVVKDIVMFPILRVAYQTGGSSAADRLDGALGVVTQSLDPTGYVSVASELWSAEATSASAAIAVGSIVRIVEIRGLTLLVEEHSSDEK